jgi:hypothetical protein
MVLPFSIGDILQSSHFIRNHLLSRGLLSMYQRDGSPEHRSRLTTLNGEINVTIQAKVPLAFEYQVVLYSEDRMEINRYKD